MQQRSLSWNSKTMPRGDPHSGFFRKPRGHHHLTFRKPRGVGESIGVKFRYNIIGFEVVFVPIDWFGEHCGPSPFLALNSTFIEGRELFEWCWLVASKRQSLANCWAKAWCFFATHNFPVSTLKCNSPPSQKLRVYGFRYSQSQKKNIVWGMALGCIALFS